jgi:hypothetical protein
MTSVGINSEAAYQDSSYFNSEFDDAITSLMDTEGLIIDLRQNTGGYLSQVMGAFSKLFDKTMIKDAFTYRRNKQEGELGALIQDSYLPYTPAFINDGQYDNPMVVIVDSMTLSAGDCLAYIFHLIPNATVIGQPHCASFSGFANKEEEEYQILSSVDKFIQIVYPRVILYPADSQETLWGKNFVDRRIDYSYEDILEGRDTFIYEAIDIIQENREAMASN